MCRRNLSCDTINEGKVESVLPVLTTIYKRVKRRKGVESNKRMDERQQNKEKMKINHHQLLVTEAGRTKKTRIEREAEKWQVGSMFLCNNS